MIARGLVKSAHDCSEGGVLTAVSEMLIATSGGDRSKMLGCELTCAATDAGVMAFSEGPSRYVLEVTQYGVGDVQTLAAEAGLGGVSVLGTLNSSGKLTWKAAAVELEVEELVRAWRGSLDF
jgi:phosphoribosylformylglycinamidine synthase